MSEFSALAGNGVEDERARDCRPVPVGFDRMKKRMVKKGGKRGMSRLPQGKIAPLEGQIIEELMEAVKQFLEQELKEYRLPVKGEIGENQPKSRAVEVAAMAMPEPDEEHARVPYILIQPLNGKDSWGRGGYTESEVNLRLVVTIFDWDKEEGRRELLHIVETVRRSFIRAGVVGKSFALKMPLEWLIYPEDMEGYHMGEISATWSVPPLTRDVPQLRG